MKKFLKSLVAALCLVTLLMVMTGCSKGVTGKWELTAVEGAGSEAALAMAMVQGMGGSVEIEIAKNEMTLKMTMLGSLQEETMAIEITDNQIIAEDGSVMDYAIDGDELSLTQDGATMVLTRKK